MKDGTRLAATVFSIILKQQGKFQKMRNPSPPTHTYCTHTVWWHCTLRRAPIVTQLDPHLLHNIFLCFILCMRLSWEFARESSTVKNLMGPVILLGCTNFVWRFGGTFSIRWSAWFQKRLHEIPPTHTVRMCVGRDQWTLLLEIARTILLLLVRFTAVTGGCVKLNH